MKKIILILLAAAGIARADDVRDMQQMLMLLQALQGNTSQPQQIVIEPQSDSNAIYNAYPNNPEMWRYLQRNPRYIPYYLGR